jgi:hypothetical protein
VIGARHLDRSDRSARFEVAVRGAQFQFLIAGQMRSNRDRRLANLLWIALSL